MEMSRRTRDGTAEPDSRDQILRHERGQGIIHFSCSADHVQDWQLYPADPYSCYICDHTCGRLISHTCFFHFVPFVSLETSLFPSIFCTTAVFSLYGEYAVRSLLPDGVFLPCDHGLDY